MAIVNHYSCCDSDNVISTDFVQSDLCIVSYVITCMVITKDLVLYEI